MAKNIIINGITYADVPYTESPLADGSGDAYFYDTSSGNAAAGDLRANKKAWVNGVEVTGAVPTRTAADLTAAGKTVTVPAGIYDAQVQKAVADGSVTPGATVAGDEIGDTVSDYPVAVTPSATVGAGYVSGNQTGGVITKYIQTEASSVVPSVSAQTITPTAGKLIASVAVAAVDVSCTANESDVLNGKTFISGGSLTIKTGSATVPIVTQNSSTKALTIS